MKPEKLVGILTNINRILKRKKVDVKDGEVMAVSNQRAVTLYNSINYAQKRVVNKLAEDLGSSKEYDLNSVIAYATIRYFVLESMWIFENEDLVKLRKEIKKIFAQMDKKQYIHNVNRIIEQVGSDESAANNLILIKDGTSHLYNLVKAGKISIFTASKFTSLYDLSDTKEESEHHRMFRKVLNILNGLDF